MVEVRCKVGNGNAFTNLHRGLGMPERVWGMARDPGVRARVPHRQPEHLPGRAGEHFASEVRSSGDSVVPISSMSTRGRRPPPRRLRFPVPDAKPCLCEIEIARFESFQLADAEACLFEHAQGQPVLT